MFTDHSCLYWTYEDGAIIIHICVDTTVTVEDTMFIVIDIDTTFNGMDTVCYDFGEHDTCMIFIYHDTTLPPEDTTYITFDIDTTFSGVDTICYDFGEHDTCMIFIYHDTTSPSPEGPYDLTVIYTYNPLLMYEPIIGSTFEGEWSGHLMSCVNDSTYSYDYYNVSPGIDYLLNVEYHSVGHPNGDWAADSEGAHGQVTIRCRESTYLITRMRDNGFGGKNFLVTLNPDGTIE
ncbi:hypothetical protein J7K43_01280 [Candidatus Calescamantes bacterium]|nr:hypothetical protein [Candidatus Calescamantes bacterium]